MTEQIKNILDELKSTQTKLPELRDLFWLKIDRYNEIDQKRGVEFDDKFRKQYEKLVRAIDSFVAFTERSFAPSAEEIAKVKALQKLCVEFPGFNDWNEEAKKALLKREMNILLLSHNEITIKSKNIGFSKRKIKEELQNLTILNGDVFSEEFLEFYKSLDPTSSTHNSQKFYVRKYLLELGYDEHHVDSLKGNTSKSKSQKLIVIFTDGTEITNKYNAIVLAETIRKIGIERVIALNLIVDNVPFVSQDKESMYAPTLVENGYYVNTHSSTRAKKKQLDDISKRLNLNLTIYISES